MVTKADGYWYTTLATFAAWCLIGVAFFAVAVPVPDVERAAVEVATPTLSFSIPSYATTPVANEAAVSVQTPKRHRSTRTTFQRRSGAETRQSGESGSGWHTASASWYGPGFYGCHTASGATLTKGMLNFAHRTMRFGTRVEFEYKGRRVVAVCNDRGPFVARRTFDLGPGTAKALRFSGVGNVRWRYAH